MEQLSKQFRLLKRIYECYSIWLLYGCFLIQFIIFPGPTFLSKETLDRDDMMNKAAEFIEEVSGKGSHPQRYHSPNKGPGIGHKLAHSNDGNLVIVGGYDNYAGTWKNVARRIECTTFKKTNLYPDCHWLNVNIDDGIVLTTGRRDHVAMMLTSNFCK